MRSTNYCLVMDISVKNLKMTEKTWPRLKMTGFSLKKSGNDSHPLGNQNDRPIIRLKKNSDSNDASTDSIYYNLPDGSLCRVDHYVRRLKTNKS